MVAEYVKFGQDFTEIVSGDHVVIFSAETEQTSRAVRFIIKPIQINAGIHAAVKHGCLKSLRIFGIGEDKHLIGHEVSLHKILPANGSSRIVGMNLQEILFCQLSAECGKLLLVAVNALLIKIAFTGNPPNIAPVNIF